MSSFSLNTGGTRPLPGFQSRTSDVFASLAGLEQGYGERVKERGPDEFEEDGDGGKMDTGERDDDFKRPSDPVGKSGTFAINKDRGVKRPAPPHYSGRSERDGDRQHGQGVSTSRFRGVRSSGRGGWQGKNNRTPDFKLHPERWTEYSLRDTDVMSDTSNKRAAVDFFRELRDRKAKEAQNEPWDAELYTGKIEFKKPASNKSGDANSSKSESEGDSSEKARGSYSRVHKMPEYVIGQSKPKAVKSKTKICGTTGDDSESISMQKSDVNLGHLGSQEESEQVAASESDLETSQTRLNESSVSVSGKDGEGEKEEGVKEEKVVFKKGKGKRKIRERREEDG